MRRDGLANDLHFSREQWTKMQCKRGNILLHLIWINRKHQMQKRALTNEQNSSVFSCTHPFTRYLSLFDHFIGDLNK